MEPSMNYDLHNNTFNEEVKAKKTRAVIELVSTSFGQNMKDILVVGCGSGREAGMLARAFKANVTGIDLGDDYAFDHVNAAPAKLLKMDARDLKFPTHSFDMVFSFHVLEHIPEPERALAEMSRVLRPRGVYLIGTPNRSRLVGRFTSPYPLRLKILWNIQDLSKRLTGRWNSADSEAGFTPAELHRYCTSAFGNAADVSELYYRSLYKRRQRAIDVIRTTGLKKVVFPSVYIAGTKSGAASSCFTEKAAVATG
jgi:ubiquinone/menaquinone biosynthesis C-methylase UbiE